MSQVVNHMFGTALTVMSPVAETPDNTVDGHVALEVWRGGEWVLADSEFYP